MSWLDLLSVRNDGVDVGSVHRLILNIIDGPTATSNDATGAFDLDFGAWLDGANVTAAASGTVGAFGATVNTVLQSDGSTPGGVWQDHLDLGTSPATGGDVRLSPDGCIVINDGAGADLYVIAHSSAIGTVYMGTPDADVEVIGGDHLKLVTDADGTVVDIAGGVALDFPSAVDVTFSGNPTVDGGTNIWSFDRMDIDADVTLDTAAYFSRGTSPSATGLLRLSHDAGVQEVVSARHSDTTSTIKALALQGDVVYLGYHTGWPVKTFMQAFDDVQMHNAYGYNAGLDAVGMLLPADTHIGATLATPSLYQATDTVTGGVRPTLLVHAQDSTVAGSTGGDLHLRPGHGVTTHGELELQDAAATYRMKVSSAGNLDLNPAAALNINVASTERLYLDGTMLNISVPLFQFTYLVAAPVVTQETDDAADVEADDLIISAQGVSAAGGTHAHAGNLGIKGGSATGLAANTDGNVWLHVSPGALANWQGAEKVLAVADAVTLPTTGLANFVFLYSHTGHLECVDHDGVTHLLG